jgi:AsmA protein
MKKALKITGIAFLTILLILFLFPFLFKGRIQQEVKNLANSKLRSELNFTDMSLSFFSHFPNLTLTLTDFLLKGSPPFESDTMISAHAISFGVNVASLFGKTIRINRIYFERAKIFILFNEHGEPNYNVYKSADTTASADTAKAAGAEFKIEHIYLKNCRFVYADPSIPVRVDARGFNYSGVSELTNDIFKLTSDVGIDSLDVIYDNKKYLDSKPVQAILTTKINTDNLSVNFERNDIMVKDIPFKIQGRFDFEKEGYRLFIHFSSVMGKEYLTATIRYRQTSIPWIFARANARIDLSRWTKAFGLQSAEVRGQYLLDLKAEGPYITGPDPESLRKDTITLSIPNFDITSKLTGGYVKYKTLPQAVSNINFSLDASCTANKYENINIRLEDLRATVVKNEIKGFFRIKGLKDMPVEADLTGACDLSELKQAIPMDSVSLSGLLDFDIKVKGNYAPDKKMFPVTTAFVNFKDGSLRTNYYPHPVENIYVHAEITNRTGTMKDLDIQLKPVNFRFEGKSFTMNAFLNNFDDLKYDVKANGVIDLGKIYKVFSRKGMELDGNIETDLSLKGRQSDATAGRYELLHNSGTLKLHDISFSSELFPRPFIIRTGNFRFDQDKVWFDHFLANYGASDFNLKGAISNILNYTLSKGGTLKGDFQLNSDFVNVDEFMAFAVVDSAKKEMVKEETGVVIIPPDLDIEFKAAIKNVAFEGLKIKDLDGELDIKKGILVLKETGFSLIDCKVMMDATYGSITPQKAFFDFKIKAEDFDIKRAYSEIAMFHDLASSAGKAEGIISIDYNVKGRLNAEMSPVMPSLEGGGTVSLKKVKVSGLKLFNDISKSTEKEKISNPDMSKVDIKSTIKNNTITLDQFKFKVSGIRIRMSGTTTFDSRLNLKIRLGLPPLGIFGIPLKVTGPMENLKIKYGKGGTGDEVKESEYSDQLPPEMLQRIKSAKEEDDTPEEPVK